MTPPRTTPAADATAKLRDDLATHLERTCTDEGTFRDQADWIVDGPVAAYVAGLVAERDEARAHADEYCVHLMDAKNARDRLAAENARLRDALRPFAKAGELFGPRDAEGYDMSIYRPAAGDEYELCGDDLRRARAVLTPADGGSDA